MFADGYRATDGVVMSQVAKSDRLLDAPLRSHLSAPALNVLVVIHSLRAQIHVAIATTICAPSPPGTARFHGEPRATAPLHAQNHVAIATQICALAFTWL